MTRSIFLILTVIALLLVLLISFMSWGVLRRHSLNQDSSDLAIETTRAVLAEGDYRMLRTRAHPSLLDDLPPESLSAYVRSLPERMGPLEEISAISGGLNAEWWQLQDDSATADFELSVRFSFGQALVRVAMAQLEQRWLFTSFEVQSPLLQD